VAATDAGTAEAAQPNARRMPDAAALLAAALALPGVMPASAVAQTAPDQGVVAMRYFDYRDWQPGAERMNVHSPSLYFLKPISDSLSFGTGLRVRCVRKEGPAASAGLQIDDRLTTIDGAEATEAALDRIVREAPLSVEVGFEALRRGETISGAIRPGASAPTR